MEVFLARFSGKQMMFLSHVCIFGSLAFPFPRDRAVASDLPMNMDGNNELLLVTGRLGVGVVDSSVLCCTAEGVLCSLYYMCTV